YHFSASPYSGMIKSGSWRVSGTHSCPRVRKWIVSPACVGERTSAPNDHFGARPHCCLRIWAARSVRDGGGCPSVRAWVVPPAGVQAKSAAAPDDHLTPCPDCRVIVAAV